MANARAAPHQALDGAFRPEVAANQHTEAQDRCSQDVHVAAAVVADGPEEPDGIDQRRQRCPLRLMLRHPGQKDERGNHQRPAANPEETGQDTDADPEPGENEYAANQITLQWKSLPAG